ncbi:DNA integration/recombination/invertion protein [Pseudooceanicola batsensis HTCC2597]|uniref:DNA integration/recombination/invertion protein n=1 Tax=Pseudooceanicola batsensis (strain ATCC BAA-863 / DSM 15984 / KCTC 12145 / HTCC2597) TaxID=252305 RepID=A3TTH8_PSEBH|nr:DNA integration/recombination/invertion protein [Pseudooceanicola batsensis HTCC2597]
MEPIRDLAAIAEIKKKLSGRPRDLCLFTLGINTAYRANELLSIRVGQVAHLRAGDVLSLKQSKNGRYRTITLNGVAVEAIQTWLEHHPKPEENAPLFWSQRTRKSLSVSPFINMVKGWCAEAGLKGNYGSHTLRKTWGYHQLRGNTKTPPHLVLPLLMEAYGHARQQQTLEYLCIQSDEVASLFMQVEL